MEKLNFDQNKCKGRGRKGKNRNRCNSLTKEQQNAMREQQRKKEYFLAAGKKYPTLIRVINDINDCLVSRQLAAELEDLIKKKLIHMYENPPSLPYHAKCLMKASEALDLNADYTKKVLQHDLLQQKH